MIRRVLPKKTSFDNLTQDDVSLLMSHINSYTRKKLNDQSANQLFSFFYGGDTLAKPGIKEIPANEINLTPYLLKNKMIGPPSGYTNTTVRGGIKSCKGFQEQVFTFANWKSVFQFSLMSVR